MNTDEVTDEIKHLQNLKRRLEAETKDGFRIEIGKTYYSLYNAQQIEPKEDWHFDTLSLNNPDFDIYSLYSELFSDREIAIQTLIDKRQSEVDEIYSKLEFAERQLERAKQLKGK